MLDCFECIYSSNFPLYYLLQTFLKELAGQFEERETAPPFLYINGRVAPGVSTPEEVSKALSEALTNQAKIIKGNLGEDVFNMLVSSLKIKIGSSLPLLVNGTVEAEFVNEVEKDGKDLKLTTAKYEKIFTAFKVLDKRPVIVIGMAQNLENKNMQIVFSHRFFEFLISLRLIVSKIFLLQMKRIT